MHPDARGWVERHAPSTHNHVLEFGSRDINGNPRDLFGHAMTYTGVDLRAGHCVNVIADAAQYRHHQQVDVVVCTEVLEHDPHPWQLVESAYANLKSGGTFIVTCAGPERYPHSGHHEGDLEPDEWYANVAQDQLERWLMDAGFVEVLVDGNVNDTWAVARKP